mgnify:CR=1 FL=1
MGGIPDDLIEEIRAQADIVQIVGEHVPLRRSGRTYRGPCPLHGGERPNFSVDPQRGIFKCFVCGQGGDVFAFPMKRLGLGFLDAVRYVAERTGIRIPESAPAPAYEPHGDLREALAFAAEFYRRQLWETDEGAVARAYLERREVPRPVAEELGLGYAPAGWRALRDAAHTHGIGDDVLERAGLVKRSERARDPYDHFRARLLFPIEDLRRRVVGFGGRTLGDDPEVPRYLNSPDTPVFHKGRLLYGLARSRAAIRRAGCALVVEGYMDYVSLVARGIENVVAPLGTGCTPEQAQVLARYTDRAVLLYDHDAAGLRATFRAADELLRAGIHPHVATLPPAEDPDSLVRRGGAEALRPFVDGAVDVLERKIQILRERGFLESVDGRRRAVEALLPTVRAAADEALRDIYLDRVAQATGVRRATLERALREQRPGRKPRAVRGAETPPPPPRLGPERKILVLALREPGWVADVARRVGPDDFLDPRYRELFRRVVAWAPSALAEPATAREQWAAALPPELRELGQEIANDPEEFTDARAALEHSVARLVERRRRRERMERRRQLTQRPDDEEWMRYLVEIQEERARARPAPSEVGQGPEDA